MGAHTLYSPRAARSFAYMLHQTCKKSAGLGVYFQRTRQIYVFHYLMETPGRCTASVSRPCSSFCRPQLDATSRAVDVAARRRAPWTSRPGSCSAPASKSSWPLCWSRRARDVAGGGEAPRIGEEGRNALYWRSSDTAAPGSGGGSLSPPTSSSRLPSAPPLLAHAGGGGGSRYCAVGASSPWGVRGLLHECPPTPPLWRARGADSERRRRGEAPERSAPTPASPPPPPRLTPRGGGSGCSIGGSGHGDLARRTKGCCATGARTGESLLPPPLPPPLLTHDGGMDGGEGGRFRLLVRDGGGLSTGASGAVDGLQLLPWSVPPHSCRTE